MKKRKTTKPISTGIDGLDEILRGGLAPSNLYMLQGAPGAGKTTAALQFLRAGIAAGDGEAQQPVDVRIRLQGLAFGHARHMGALRPKLSLA